MMAVVS